MGTHNSKENQQLKSPINENNTWQSSNPPTKKSSIINKQTNYYGWQEIYRGSHADWLHEISGKEKKGVRENIVGILLFFMCFSNCIHRDCVIFSYIFHYI